MFQQPHQFGGRKIGVQQQTRTLSYQRFGTGLMLQTLTQIRGTAILPDNGVIEWFTGMAIPQQRGFALIGDTGSNNIASGKAGFLQ